MQKLIMHLNKNIKCLLALMILTVVWVLPAQGTETYLWDESNEKNSYEVDHQQWQQILNRYVIDNHESGVNRFAYGEVSKPDKQQLESYINQLAATEPRDLNQQEQKAYWINLYNAITVNLILDNYPLDSIKDLGGFFSRGPWDDKLVTISGEALTLNDIEHKILRPIYLDNRVHYSINCASYGCPDLAKVAYTSSNIEQLLIKNAKAYINHPRGVKLQDGQLTVSSIYHWFSEDFGDSDEKLMLHLMQFADADLQQQLKGYQGDIDHEYDWSLNTP